MNKDTRKQLLLGTILTIISISLLKIENDYEKESKIISYQRNEYTNEIEEKEINITNSYNKVLKK